MKIGNREKREIKENKTEKELEPKRAAATQFGPLGFPHPHGPTPPCGADMWAPLASPLSRTHRQVGPVLLPLLFPLHDNQTKPAAAKNRIRGIGRKSSRIRKR